MNSGALALDLAATEEAGSCGRARDWIVMHLAAVFCAGHGVASSNHTTLTRSCIDNKLISRKVESTMAPDTPIDRLIHVVLQALGAATGFS